MICRRTFFDVLMYISMYIFVSVCRLTRTRNFYLSPGSLHDFAFCDNKILCEDFDSSIVIMFYCTSILWNSLNKVILFLYTTSRLKNIELIWHIILYKCQHFFDILSPRENQTIVLQISNAFFRDQHTMNFQRKCFILFYFCCFSLLWCKLLLWPTLLEVLLQPFSLQWCFNTRT